MDPISELGGEIAQGAALMLIRETLRRAPNARELEASGFEIHIKVTGRRFEVLVHKLTAAGLIVPP